MKKTLAILLIGVVVAFATAPTLTAPDGAAGIFHSPYVGAAFGSQIYTNNIPMDGSTYANIGSAQLDTGSGLDSRMADDFTLAAAASYGGVEFIGGEWNGGSAWVDWTGMDIEIFADNSGVPANPPGTPLHTVHVDWANITSSTTVVDNGTSWCNHIVIENFGPIALDAGNYWFSIWPYLDRGTGDPQTGMMMTESTITGSETYFSSAYFSFPDWVTWSSVTGGNAQDLAFNMYEGSAVKEATWGSIKAL